MENSLLVSIVMCVYNGERYIGKQIESILAQSYKEFELVILDDCSTDSSIEIISYYLNIDKRVRLIQNHQNIGFNRNFEKGFSLCFGDLIAVSDQDDIWLPEKISRLVHSINDCILIYSNSSRIDEQDYLISGNLDWNIRHLDNPGYKSLLDGNFITGHTCLFKRELLNYVLPFPQHLFFYDWWLGFAAAYVGQVKYLDEVLTKYRVHSQSVYQKLTNQQTKKKTWAILERKQTEAFAAAPFLNHEDVLFIETFLIKTRKTRNIIDFAKCYYFLFKNRTDIYPGYNKSSLKRLNFIRKRCLR